MQAPAEQDSLLIDASRRGDREAFGRIIERYQRAVYAVSFASVRDRALSDDITQDTFVTAWRRLDDLRDVNRLPAWLCGIARNHARDARKRRRRDASRDRQESAIAATPFDVLSDAESDRLIAAALAEIPDAYREPLVLFYYEQQSVDDVARALEISAATVHKRLSRGRQFLAERVTAVVEKNLARRGPKPELVAGVLAAIAVLGSASHVDAFPSPKGSTMASKLTFVSLIVLSVGAAGVLSADVATKSQTKRAAPAAQNPSAGKPTPAARQTAAPPRTQPSSSRSARPIPTLQPASTAAVAVPDCEIVARHMSDLRLAHVERQDPLPAKKRELFAQSFLANTENHCRQDAWSENMRLCIVDATDYERAKYDCTDAQVATAAEVAALPPELRCDALAEHLYKLATGPDGKITIVKAKLAANPERAAALDRLAIANRAETARECEAMPWSVERRRCYAAAKTHAATRPCKP